MMSKKNTFKTALSYQGKILDNYKYQIFVHNEILEIIKSSLPHKLSKHVLYCVTSAKKVFLYTNSAAWSSQLRFYHQQMIQALKTSNYAAYETLQIKIIPPIIEQQVNKKTITVPSTEHIDLLIDQAENQIHDKLKAALLKLGSTLKKLSHSET